MSFSPAFRAAMRTVALCCHRTNMPTVLVQRIGSFLNRDWWPKDSNQLCWNTDCQLRGVRRAVEQFVDYTTTNDNPTEMKQLSDFLFPSTQNIQACDPGNNIRYCSEQCRTNCPSKCKNSHCKKLPSPKGKLTEEERQLYLDVFACDEMKSLSLPSFITSLDKNHRQSMDPNVNKEWENFDYNKNKRPYTATRFLYKYFVHHPSFNDYFNTRYG